MSPDHLKVYRDCFVPLTIPMGLSRHSCVSHGAKMCYGALVHLADETGICTAPVSEIADMICATEDEAEELIDELVSARLIRIYEYEDGSEREYRFLKHEAVL